jgi:hypothetical protein
MVITEVCKIQPDHYTVNFSEGTIQLHSVVQDYSWPGVLVVVWFVAENGQEVVVESVGWDEQGHQIARFLVVKRDQVSILERSQWGMGRFWGFQELWMKSGINLEGKLVMMCLFHIFVSPSLFLLLPHFCP